MRQAGLVRALTASACLASPVPRNNDALQWNDYPDYERNSSIRLASLVVPIDWDHPTSGAKVTLGITKLPAQDPEVRVLFAMSVGEADALYSAV